MSLSGALIGTIDGSLNWNGQVSVSETSNLNFTVTGDFNWVAVL